MTLASVGQLYQLSAGFWRCPGRPPIGPAPVVQPAGRLVKLRAQAVFTPGGGGGGSTFILGATQPDATNTGQVGTGLPVTSGDITVTTPGTVINGRKIIGRVKVQAANVTISNCEIVGNGYSGGNTALIDCNHSAVLNCTITNNLLHQDVSTGNLWHNAVIGHDYTATRNHIYNVVDGLGVYNSGNPSAAVNVDISGNYVHDLCWFSTDPNHAGSSDFHTHNDGVQIQGNSGIVIRGNTLFVNCSTTLGNPTVGSSAGIDPVTNHVYVANTYMPGVTGQCITGSPNVSQITGVTIDQNWLDYGSRGVIFIVGSKGPSIIGTCTGNRFGSHLHSATTAVQLDTAAGQTFSTFASNTWLGTGAAVTLSSGTG